jgi:hypothetical protein
MLGVAMKSGLFFSLALLLSVGCAAPRATSQTTTTAAEVASPVDRESAPPTPPGELVCRGKSTLEGTIELYVEWSGSAGPARGTLRTTAPSGAITERPVQAEKHKAMILADAPGNVDLVSHTATVTQENGKRMVRLGEPNSPWTTCE